MKDDSRFADAAAFDPDAAEFVRLASGDMEEILALEAACFSYPWNEKQYKLAFDQQIFHVFGLKHQGRIAAYLSYYHTADEMEILNLATAPQLRRRGAARRLLGLVLQISRKMGIRHGYLEVRRTNVAAQNLYAAFGFAQVGVRKGYYPDTGEDALVLRRDFDNPPQQGPQGEGR